MTTIMRRLATGMAAAALFFTSNPAAAVELCAALDGSGSIIIWGSPTDFEDQLKGLASAVMDSAIVPADGSVSIAVVHFGTVAVTEIELTPIEDSEDAAQLAADIMAITPRDTFAFYHGTNLIDVFRACLDEFSETPGEKIIDISTDGRHALPLTDPDSKLEDVLAARDAAVAAGVDTVNAIGVAGAAMDELEQIVWPQLASDPLDEGFTVYAANFTEYKEAMRDKVRSEIPLSVALDIKPNSCPNPFNRNKEGVLPAAVLGGPNLDVLEIDPSSLLFEGVAPLRWGYEDTAAHPGVTGPEAFCLDCGTGGPDGFLDLTLKFDAKEIAVLLENEESGACLLLTLTGSLMEEYGGRKLAGDDTLRIGK